MSRVSAHLRGLVANTDGRSILLLLGLFVGVVVLWDTFLATPLKIFVVFLHEISHGLAAILTGGSIVKIEFSSNQGGVCYTMGGIRFVVLTAGYLGSMLWGALILLLAARTNADKIVSVVIGAFLLVMTLLYVRNMFGFVFGLLATGGMIVMGLKLSHEVNDFVLKLIGLTSCLYAIVDISSDVLERPGIGSDADMLADHTGIPGMVWGVAWIGAAVLVSGYCLLLSAQPTRGSKEAAPSAGGADGMI